MFIQHWWYWVEIHTGIARGGPDPYYNAWSGVISDLQELAIFGLFIGAIKHFNCHVTGCKKFFHTHTVTGTHHRACNEHHPAHPTDGTVTAQFIRDAFHKAQRQDRIGGPGDAINAPGPGHHLKE